MGSSFPISLWKQEAGEFIFATVNAQAAICNRGWETALLKMRSAAETPDFWLHPVMLLDLCPRLHSAAVGSLGQTVRMESWGRLQPAALNQSCCCSPTCTLECLSSGCVPAGMCDFAAELFWPWSYPYCFLQFKRVAWMLLHWGNPWALCAGRECSYSYISNTQHVESVPFSMKLAYQINWL